jgi:hydroxymethylglutaryl-CoA reductase
VAEGILQAYDFAVQDMYRATTHNKGVMNGVDAVAVALG